MARLLFSLCFCWCCLDNFKRMLSKQLESLAHRSHPLLCLHVDADVFRELSCLTATFAVGQSSVTQLKKELTPNMLLTKKY